MTEVHAKHAAFWATVCKTVHPMLSDRCLSVQSVTLVYCGQTVGWIKMKLGTEIGLGPGHIIKDGDCSSSPQKGHSPQFSVHVCCGQTAGSIKMPLCTEVDVGPGVAYRTPTILAHVLWPNGCMDQDAI